ncbi:MAG: SDR family NAD(P)-dependent oxidoreductase [Promethearchaeota archaeon]
MLLKGKNILITGSGRGIGKTVAIACAKEGANIGLTSRTLEELNNTKKEIENLGTKFKVVLKTADITKYEEVEEAFKYFHDELGSLNGIIANAGASRMGNTHEFDPDIFDNILKVNILGVFNTFKAAYPYLKKDDKKLKARFLITGSEAYPQAMPKFTAYAASKYATVGLQRSLAAEYRGENITFNQILPTMVDTKMLRGRKAGDGNKPDNVMNPWDLNDYYLFIMSDESNKVNDQLITSSDFQNIKKIINEAPLDKKENLEIFMDYLEDKAPKTFKNVKKLKRFVEFLLMRSK